MAGTDTNSAAWAWVLANAPQVRRICDRLCASWPGLDAEDFHHAVLVRLVDRWRELDQGREPMAWVRWQAMAARKSWHKSLLRQQRETEVVHVTAWDPRDHEDAERALVAHVTVAQVHQLATPDEWAAAVARAEGYSGQELATVLGCAPFSATRRLRRLASRIA